jgi:hypothetical protein
MLHFFYIIVSFFSNLSEILIRFSISSDNLSMIGSDLMFLDASLRGITLSQVRCTQTEISSCSLRCQADWILAAVNSIVTHIL